MNCTLVTYRQFCAKALRLDEVEHSSSAFGYARRGPSDNRQECTALSEGPEDYESMKFEREMELGQVGVGDGI